VEHRDVVIQRRDGEDLHLALRSRERGIRESLGVLARIVRAALHDVANREAVAKWLAEELPWTSFLPDSDREQFLAEFAKAAVGSVEAEVYEPLIRTLEAWKATAEVHANPALLKVLSQAHTGPAVPISRPTTRRGRKR
jgi:hypothetical protein